MSLDRPAGIRRRIKKGAAYWQVTYFKNRKRVNLGVFDSKEKAVMARIDYMARHDIIYRSKKSKTIDVTPELEHKIKALKGISLYKQSRTGKIIGYRADIMRDGKKEYLGKFDTIEEAVEAYKRAEAKYAKE
jgi:hypothetical protein